ncbi:hypothetical protein GCM10010924_53070 [Rhizobium wenxiniae]|nr:hypothetical protein GCM10010924_53070 [Rhizobium wenxiniae]
MSGVADDRLVEIPDLNGKLAVPVSYRAEISNMTVAADPNRRAIRQFDPVGLLQPFVETSRATAHISMRRGSHFPVFMIKEKAKAVLRLDYGFHEVSKAERTPPVR